MTATELPQLCNRLIADPNDEQAISRILDFAGPGGAATGNLGLLDELFPGDLSDPTLFENLGIAFGEASHLPAAKWAFQRAVDAAPDRLDSLYNLGETYRRLNDHQSAIEAFERVVSIDTGHGEAWTGLATLRAVAGELEGAKSAYEACLAAGQDSALIRNNHAIILRRLGDVTGAAAGFRKAIELDPTYVRAFDNLGNTLVDAGNLAAAKTAFEAAIKLEPGYYDAHYNLGNVVRDLGDWDAAIDCFQAALRLRPDHPEARAHLGHALQHLGRYDLAAAAFEHLLAADQDDTQALGNLANVRRDQGRFDEAQKLFDRALALSSDDTRLRANKGLALLQAGQCDQAITCYRAALDREPDDFLLHNNLAHAQLLAGNFAEGWQEFEWRRRDPELAGLFDGLRGREWKGESLSGRSILIRCEQGFGDAIQFCRYIGLLAGRGAAVTLACPQRLIRLLRGVEGIDKIMSANGPLPICDYWAGLLSLPGLHGTELETVPTAASYLTAEAAMIEKWKEKTAGGTGFKIGIAWQGNPDYAADRARSVSLQELTPLLRPPGIQVYSLQQGYGAEQLGSLGAAAPVIDFAPEMDADDAFVDTAGLMAGLDLIISSDTAIPHLAAALGRPVWMLTSFAPDWRWLLGRTDSPWYPSLRLARQPEPGDWASVVTRLETALARCVEGEAPLTAFDAVF